MAVVPRWYDVFESRDACQEAFEAQPMFEGEYLHPDFADDHGLVAVGGNLSMDRLLLAYRRGIFPWYNEGMPVCWWSPDPRSIFPMEGPHISRRLARTIRSGRFRVTFDQNFRDVMIGCADRMEGTWITQDMLTSYCRLHRAGHAHSVEVWLEDQLVGGAYGVALGGLFAAESMFYRIKDASKVALVCLFERLRAGGFCLFDTQVATDHTRRLGAIDIPRKEYLNRLNMALRVNARF